MAKMIKKDRTPAQYGQGMVFAHTRAFAATVTLVFIDAWQEDVRRERAAYAWAQKYMSIGFVHVAIQEAHFASRALRQGARYAGLPGPAFPTRNGDDHRLGALRCSSTAWRTVLEPEIPTTARIPAALSAFSAFIPTLPVKTTSAPFAAITRAASGPAPPDIPEAGFETGSNFMFSESTMRKYAQRPNCSLTRALMEPPMADTAIFI